MIEIYSNKREDKQTALLFLLMVLVQGCHSIEEYIGRLWETFPPATILCGLLSDDLEQGFLIINIGLFVFGILSWIFLIKTGHGFSQFFIWFWIILELINGIGHPIWTYVQRAYTPGVITAPVLLLLSLQLLQRQFKTQ